MKYRGARIVVRLSVPVSIRVSRVSHSSSALNCNTLRDALHARIRVKVGRITNRGGNPDRGRKIIARLFLREIFTAGAFFCPHEPRASTKIIRHFRFVITYTFGGGGEARRGVQFIIWPFHENAQFRETPVLVW